VNINLHLTDDTQLRAHGFVASSGLFAEVEWDFHGPFSDSRGDGVLWGTPGMMRQLAAQAIQAAIQAEEEAAWQTRLADKRPTEGAQVA
jgi:hypothetical protein